MTTPKRLTMTYLALTAGLLVLFGMNLLWGSVSLTPQAVLAALLGKGQDALSMGIILQLRLPRAVMVILLGAALSVAGSRPFLPTPLRARLSWAFPAVPSWPWPSPW